MRRPTTTYTPTTHAKEPSMAKKKTKPTGFPHTIMPPGSDNIDLFVTQRRTEYVQLVHHIATPGLTAEEAFLEELTAAADALEYLAEREPENADEHLETAVEIKNAVKVGDTATATAAAAAAGLIP